MADLSRVRAACEGVLRSVTSDQEAWWVKRLATVLPVSATECWDDDCLVPTPSTPGTHPHQHVAARPPLPKPPETRGDPENLHVATKVQVPHNDAGTETEFGRALRALALELPASVYADFRAKAESYIASLIDQAEPKIITLVVEGLEFHIDPSKVESPIVLNLPGLRKSYWMEGVGWYVEGDPCPECGCPPERYDGHVCETEATAWTDAEIAAYAKGADDGYEAGRYVALQEVAIAAGPSNCEGCKEPKFAIDQCCGRASRVAPEDQIGYQLGQIAGLHGASGPAQLAAERALYEFFSRGIEDYDYETVTAAVKSAICDAIEEAAKPQPTPLEEWEEMESKIPDSTDAWVWAKAFMKLFGQDLATLATVDEGLMIGWFANAIESGRRAGEKTEFLAKADETWMARRARSSGRVESAQTSRCSCASMRTSAARDTTEAFTVPTRRSSS